MAEPSAAAIMQLLLLVGNRALQHARRRVERRPRLIRYARRTAGPGASQLRVVPFLNARGMFSVGGPPAI